MNEGIHVYRPERWIGRSVRRCYKCRRVRRHVVYLYEWHEPLVRCCSCGTQREREQRRSEWSKAKTVREALAEMLVEVFRGGA